MSSEFPVFREQYLIFDVDSIRPEKSLPMSEFYSRNSVPVRDVDHVEKRKPLFPFQIPQRNFIERSPVWPFRSLPRRFIPASWGVRPPFAVTGRAATDNVFPRAPSSVGTRERYDQAQITLRNLFPPVLASAFVPGVNIKPRKADLANGHAVIREQEDDSRILIIRSTKPIASSRSTIASLLQLSKSKVLNCSSTT
jgi:hypothetical protein